MSRSEVGDLASVRRPKRAVVVLGESEPQADPAARICDDDLARIPTGSASKGDIAATRRPRRATHSPPARCQPHRVGAIGAREADPAIRRGVGE